MKTLKPFLLIVLVFAAGVMLGVGGTRLAVRRVIEGALKNPSVVQARIERELTRELRLKPEQRLKVHEVLERSQGELREIRDEFRPRVGRILKRSETGIRSVLDEGQQQRFDRLLQKRPMVPAAFPAGSTQ